METSRLPVEDEVVGESEADYFPHYNRLPPEVRGIILGELTSTADKLNVLTAIPTEIELMKWDVLGSLVLPQVIQRGLLDWRDILNLSCANAKVQHFLTQAFMQNIKTENTYSLPSVHIKDLALFLNENNNCKLNPLPVTIRITSVFVEDPNWLQILEAFGSRIWNCSISLTGIQGRMQFDTVRKCLLAMPNLIRVKVSYRLDSFDSIDESYLRNLRAQEQPPGSFPLLPELAQLQSLKIEPNFNSVVWAPLLNRYSQQLTTLAIEDCYDIILPGRAFPNLANLRLNGPSSHILTTLASFAGSPLKHISVLFFIVGSRGYKEAVRILSNQFGNTLEELTLVLERKNVGGSSPEWETNLSFSKVKRLTLGGNVPLGWSILLKFPALERLILHNQNFPANQFFDDSPVLELSWDKKKMLESNVWDLLSTVQSIEFNKWNATKLETAYQITRQQFVNFQEKKTAST